MAVVDPCAVTELVELGLEPELELELWLELELGPELELELELVEHELALELELELELELVELGLELVGVWLSNVFELGLVSRHVDAAKALLLSAHRAQFLRAWLIGHLYCLLLASQLLASQLCLEALVLGSTLSLLSQGSH